MIKKLLAAVAVISAAALLQPADAAPRERNAGHARAAAHQSAPRASAPRAARPRAATRHRATRHQATQSRRSSQARQARQHRREQAQSRRATAREARQNRREAAQSRRNNSAQAKAANERREKAHNARQERREAAREQRQKRRDAAQNRQERRDARQKRQKQRQAAQERREQRRNAAENRRERRETRQDRQQRREARQERRERRAANRARVNRQQARQGRFAARYARQQARRDARISYRHNRWAWRHNRWAGFVPWYGPVFWPYAYADIFGYTFWPYGYQPGYWAYAYDDFFDGVFWGYDGPPSDYVYAPDEAPAARTARKAAPVKYATARDLCKQPGSGITAWPFDDIVKKVRLDGEQKQLLDEMRDASKDAAKQFAESCPPDSNFASTPPGRLDSMTARLNATLQAVGVVRPSLERFYASLSDEQKGRFNEIGPSEAKIAAASGKKETQGAGSDQAAANCSDPKPGLANLPIERIENAVHPSEAQEGKLKELETATNDAVGILQAACPDEVPMTPPGRLEAMETRLKAMVEAANTVKPSLDSFYSSLDDEQKARFNKLGREIAANDE
jgi:hypothetical protein